MEDSSFLGENLCFLQWDKSNRAMTNAGELKFFSNYRTVRKKKEKKARTWPFRGYLAPNVGWVEKSRNNFAFIFLFFILFFQHLGVLKIVWVYLFATFFFGLVYTMIFNIIKTPSQFSLSNQIKKRAKQNKTKVKKQQQKKVKWTTWNCVVQNAHKKYWKNLA